MNALMQQVWLLLLPVLAADPPDPRGYVCRRATAPIVIDGKLDDPAWAAAPWSDAFVDIEGDAKPRPRFKTRMKMLWDDKCLYIGAELEEPHLWATITQHDAVIFQDHDFEVFLDPDGDNHNYAELELNAKNTTWDLLLTKPYRDGGRALHAWEIVGLKTAVHLNGTINDPRDTDRGWTVEIAWPWEGLKELSSVPLPPRDGDQWRINFSRVEWDMEIKDGAYQKIKGSPEHNWVWSPQGVIDMHRPERWGYLQFRTKSDGDAFRPDPDRKIRDQLQCIYEAQRKHHEKTGAYTDSLAALSLDAAQFPKELRIERTTHAFDASLPSPSDPAARWVISQDSWIRKFGPTQPKKQVARWWDDKVEQALASAGPNRSELEAFLNAAPTAQRPGAAFLVANMPDADLRSLKSDFLLTNTALAYQARAEVPWGKDIPEDLFLNDVLPYANVDEKRDAWRSDFYALCLPIAKSSKTPAEAAHKLNFEIFQKLNVKYSTQRKAPNQSPKQSIETGLASCTGLSIMLADACRAVCIPARLAGTPLWANKRGNHTWVEVWDQGWHFTGACEPDPKGLDRGWFIADASEAKKDVPEHAIYASSFKKTGASFPLVWARRNKDVPGENVTDRYAKKTNPKSAMARVMVRVTDSTNKRVAVSVSVMEVEGKGIFSGTSRGETADTNDLLTFELKPHTLYLVVAEGPAKTIKTGAAGAGQTLDVMSTIDSPDHHWHKSAAALYVLRTALADGKAPLGQLESREFADVPLTRGDADAARKLLWRAHVERIVAERADEMKANVIKDGKLEMPFFTKTFGAKPKDGRSLWISMHGGGGAPKKVNDRQWENQKKLYTLDEGVYLAPRGPTDTWNLWHEAHIDRMFTRLIENMIVFEDVNPDRVYLMGYSAGGDGVYQMAPRMADAWAAAAMMAGHPNGVSLLSLRNVPFALQVGANDSAYNRNKVGREYGEQLDRLQKGDSKGYEHFVKIREGKSHWMGGEDKEALPWMAKFTRNPIPDRIVWKQTGTPHDRSYWLAVPKDQAKVGSLLAAERSGQTIKITAAEDVKSVIIHLDDRMLDLDQPVVVVYNGKTLYNAIPPRTVKTMLATLAGRGDPKLVFDAEIVVELPSR